MIMQIKDMNASPEDELKANKLIGLMYDAYNVGQYVGRLYRCSARIISYDRYIVLVSYNTPVAIYDDFTENLYDLLRPVYGYTATSSQHISKFSKWLAENNYPVKEFVRFIY